MATRGVRDGFIRLQTKLHNIDIPKNYFKRLNVLGYLNNLFELVVNLNN